MARKTLEDFNYDHQAFADYLESAECANDDGYDILVDVESGNIYERTDKDWTKGHGHKNVFNGYDRDKDDERSKGRKWKNPWLKYVEKLNFTEEEIKLLKEYHMNVASNNTENQKSFTRKKTR